jgi:hypothetical protein
MGVSGLMNELYNESSHPANPLAAGGNYVYGASQEVGNMYGLEIGSSGSGRGLYADSLLGLLSSIFDQHGPPGFGMIGPGTSRVSNYSGTSLDSADPFASAGTSGSLSPPMGLSQARLSRPGSKFKAYIWDVQGLAEDNLPSYNDDPTHCGNRVAYISDKVSRTAALQIAAISGLALARFIDIPSFMSQPFFTPLDETIFRTTHNLVDLPFDKCSDAVMKATKREKQWFRDWETVGVDSDKQWIGRSFPPFVINNQLIPYFIVRSSAERHGAWTKQSLPDLPCVVRPFSIY